MSSKITNKSGDKISEFGKRLKEAFNNSSNQLIAEKLGVSKPALTAYMQGRIPPPDKLIEIAKLTECSLDWLLTGDAVKAFSPDIARPQGIILHGSKSAIGTSTSAVLIAATLALKGYGVLLADDALHTCSDILFPSQTLSEVTFQSEKRPYKDLLNDTYLPTRHEKFDFFVPRGQNRSSYPTEKKQIFNFDYLEMQKKYQFVIFDVQRGVNPFYYRYDVINHNFRLEPILRNAKVIVPFDPQQSIVDNVVMTKEYVDAQKTIYPAAEFLGLFFIELKPIYKRPEEIIKEKLKDLEALCGSKIFKTKIAHHKWINKSCEDFEKILFSRKTNIFHNFSELVDELLSKLSPNV